MIQQIRVTEITQWINTTFERHDTIKISGGFRGNWTNAEKPLDIFELHGKYAHTVRILVPEHPMIESGDIGTTAFKKDGIKWWNGWAPVLTATCLVSPTIDPQRLTSLLQEKRRLRFCCDTNALSRGVAAWLLTVFEGCAELVTSAVVDREFAAWPERYSDMWMARTAEDWSRRTQYRLGLRTTETPPDGVVIGRLSPEQGALMLAKLRDETSVRSPDADMLLIELARGLIRDQPRNARIIYLTGDHGNARAAANALGADNVLYASTDDSRAKAMQGKVAARGWWQPDGPLGTTIIPSTGRFLWDLLAACSFLVLETNKGKWHIKSVESVPRGVPSDWADPWIEVEQLAHTVSVDVPLQNDAAFITDNTEPDEPQTNFILPDPDIEQSVESISPASSWLLAPVWTGEPLAVSVGLRPTRTSFFEIIWQVLSGQAQKDGSPSQTANEVKRILTALEVINDIGEAGPRLEEYRLNWRQNNLDWFHAELSRLPGYQSALAELRADAQMNLGERQRTQISMARTLGQVARNEQVGTGLYVGDAPVSVELFRSALNKWIPNIDDTLSTEQLCVLTEQELQLTPSRTEVALARLWELAPELPFEGRTGGTANANSAENVVVLSASGYNFHPVSPGALTFGRSGPVRFIVRTS